MTVKKNVFASRSERENFYKIQRVWGENYHIHHNLPFLNVFDTEKLIDITDIPSFRPFVLKDIEVNRLKKTSIDYTLCDEKDTPILCIEFDGLQQGFNVGTTYYPETLISKTSPWRREITELKLKVARGSLFPFFVVGSKQFQDISSELKLTIVDGIIGDVLTNKAIKNEVDNFSIQNLSLSEEEFNNLSPDYRDLLIQDWLDGVEIEKNMENNPIYKRQCELESELKLFVNKLELLAYPDFAPGDIEGFKNIILRGHKVTYETSDMGDVSEECWLPNFEMPGFGGWVLTENIAALFALDRIRNVREKK